MKKHLRSVFRFMRRNRAMTKIISFALSLILVFYVIPSTIYTKAAELLDGSDEPISEVDASSSSAGSVSTSQPTGVLFEDVSLREESVKHFHLEDGTYLAAQYNYPVHTKDSSGEWQDIDNALSESGSEFSNSNARIKFAKKINGSSELFALHDGNTKLSLSLIDAKKGVVGEITNNSDTEADTELQKMMNLEKLSASVIYRDIIDGVDLEYVAYSMNVKENIIVKEKKDSYTYSFEFKLNGLIPTLTESGDIEIREDGAEEIKYLIPAPVVFDANGEHAPSAASAYTLTHENGKKYILTVTVDSAWMNDEQRAFPVTVDPTVESAQTGIIDTYINSRSSSFTGNTSVLLYVDSWKTAYWKSENLPTVPRSANIIDATFKITVEGYSSSSYVGVYEVITPWDSGLCSDYRFNYGDGLFNSLATDYCYVTGTGNYTFDITRIVKAWYDGNEGGDIYQYGIGFAPLSGYSASVSFHSNEASDSSARPTLTITYKDMKGVESYWPITSHSAGTAGSGSVNLANGNLVFTIPTLTATDSIFSFTPTLVYDASMSGKAYYDQTSEIGITSPFLGNGFKLNMNETLRCYSDDDVTVYYVYSDADGTEHYFFEDEETGAHIDEDGLGLTLTKDSSGNITIASESGGIRFFERVSHADFGTRWRLSYYQDIYGNRLVYSYMQIYYDLFKPTKVSLLPNGHTTAIDLLELRYHSTTGRLIMVYNPATEAAAVLRYSSTYNGDIVPGGYLYLRQIDYAYGNSSVTSANWDAFSLDATSATNISVYSTAKYNYDSAGRLIEAQDVTNGTSIKYTWQNYNLNNVKEYAGTTLGQQLGLSYDVGFAEVRATGNDEILNTSDDILTRYTMDIYGRAVSVYSCSSDGSEMYGATSGVYDDASRENNLKNKAVVGGSAVNFLLNGDFEEFDANGNFLHWTHDSLVYDFDAYPQSDFGYNMAGFTPTNSQDATLSQTVFLPAGEYNLSMIYASRSCLNYEAEVSITSTIGSGLSLTESLSLNKESVTLKKSSFSTSFEVASYQSGGDYVEVKITVGRSAAGSNNKMIKIDNVMLSNTVGAADYSFVRYGNFEESSLGSGTSEITPDNYWTCSGEFDTYSVYFGNYALQDSVRVEGNLGSSYVKQRIFEVSEDDLYYFGTQDFQSNALNSYLISGFGYAPAAISTDDAKIRLRVDVYYRQLDGSDDVVINHYFDFLPGIDNWQFVSGSFDTKIIPESDSERRKYICVSAIDVYCEYNNQPYGYALFDNISIIRADADNYVEYAYYNEEGKEGLLAMKRTSEYTEYYDYDDNKNLSAVATSDGDMTFYSYVAETPHQLDYTVQCRYTYNADNFYPTTNVLPFSSSSIQYETRTDYYYDYYGNVIETRVSSFDGSIVGMKTRTSFTYDTGSSSVMFGALKTETDATGTTIRYYYDPDTCMLDATVNETSGNGLVYNYDSLRRLVSVTPGQYVSSSTYTETTNAEKVEYTYGTDNMLEGISTVTTDYTFSYDEFGNRVWVKAGDNTLATYEYAEKNGKLKKTTYGNGFVVEYVYNDLENLSEIWYTEGEGASVKAYEYEYTADGQIHSVKDNINGRQTVYTYDSRNRVANVSNSSTDSYYNNLFTHVEYDDIGRPYTDFTYINVLDNTVNDDSIVGHTYFYYGENNQLSQMLINTTGALGGISYDYDELYRLSTEEVTLGSFDVSYAYNYKNYGDFTSGQIGSVTTTVNETTTKSATYSYDSDGNITRIDYSDGEYVAYTYDDLGQLVREDNSLLSKTYLYSYDNAGNITNKSSYQLTATNVTPTIRTETSDYIYSNSGWGDLLTSYDGNVITYDEIGNPLKYNNGVAYTFRWEGRLITWAMRKTKMMTFTYNEGGLRSTKTTGNVKTTYYYQGSLLIAEETNSQILVYLYDANGSPVGFKYRDSSYASGTWDTYAYEKNIQGDIVAVYDVSTGTKLVTYKYNAWGDCSTFYANGGSSTTAKKNPFRYRGYYYDSDLDLYYLQSRYYDSNTGRFISPDSLMSGVNGGLHGFNLYAYCFNNPISFTDSQGNWPSLSDLYEWYEEGKEKLEEFAEEVKEKVNDAYNNVTEWAGDRIDEAVDWYNEKNEFDPTDAEQSFEGNNFNYDSSGYNLINANDYAVYLKTNYYQDSNRTIAGLYVELQGHYILRPFKIPNVMNGADMGEAVWSVDKTAVISEVIATPFVFIDESVKFIKSKF